jgi:hypothetical protein
MFDTFAVKRRETVKKSQMSEQLYVSLKLFSTLATRILIGKVECGRFKDFAEEAARLTNIEDAIEE